MSSVFRLLWVGGLVLLWASCGQQSENQISSPDFRPGEEMKSLHGTWVAVEEEDEFFDVDSRMTFRPDGTGKGHASGLGREQSNEIASYQVAKEAGLYLIQVRFENGEEGRLLFDREEWNRATIVRAEEAGEVWPTKMEEETIKSTPGWGTPYPTTYEME